MTTSTRPKVGRQASRVPGGFETDEELSPIKTEFEHEDLDSPYEETSSKCRQPPPTQPPTGDESGLNAMSEDGRTYITGEGETLDEGELHRKLMDMDSSFLPATSPAAQAGNSGADDTYVLRGARPSPGSEYNQRDIGEAGKEDDMNVSPDTPSEMYKTPAPGREEMSIRSSMDHTETVDDFAQLNTSLLETMSSSPTAAAAARTVSRAVSMASSKSYETADDTHDSGVPLELEEGTSEAGQEPTPKKTTHASGPSSREASPTPTKPTAEKENQHSDRNNHENPLSDRGATRQRPAYLNSRMASQRSSYSSYTTISTEDVSEATVGADYALQSGGSVPYDASLNSRPSLASRSVTLGSMASEISSVNDGNGDVREGLDTLNEEEDPTARGSLEERDMNQEPPHTPKGSHHNLHTPTETVIAQHVKDVQVPATMAREFRNRNRLQSPDKRSGGPAPSVNHNGKAMTLKEQNNTIDKYVKLNWDLQLKITFLNQALNQRSEEGVKAMISENVELNTARVNFAKEIRELKRSIRVLERDLEKRNDEIAQLSKATQEAEARVGPSDQEVQDLENEVVYLREQVETYEFEFEKMLQDNMHRHSEKSTIAGMAQTASRRGQSDIGVHEELDYYRQELEAETARREEADEENKTLREEIWRLQADSRPTTEHNSSTAFFSGRNGRPSSSHVSHTGRGDRDFDHNGTSTSAASSTLVEQLRHENARLQRDMRAQESMLTSRNKEKEHLYQEIEELKLSARRGDGTRSIAGDSIFERSVSRAHRRTTSRQSEAPAAPHVSDTERENFESKNGELRDQINKLKLENQELTRQLKLCYDELRQFDQLKIENDKLQQAYDEDIGVATEDLQGLQSERDEALQAQEQLDAELEEQRLQLQDLQAQATERIDNLDDELDQRARAMEGMEKELSNRAEETDSLRAEVRSLSERILRIGEDTTIKAKKLERLEAEVGAMNNENEELHKNRGELRDQHERLSVQYESSQSQIAFLREEQDGDKMKIGELEDSLSNIQTKLNSEKEHIRELEKRLADERHQREVIGGKEKQEVQEIINDLNREASGARDESRQLKASLQTTEIELTTWKERLLELESHLRESLGDSNGTRSTFLTSISKLQKELEGTSADLENTRHFLSEKERRLKDRDSLLESHGLESKKLSDLLERERQGRRADKAQHEQWQRSHQHTTRTVSQKDTRIAELESSKHSDRKRFQILETQLRENLNERNNLLLMLWSRLSTTCGPDWQHQNSLINGHVATLEVVDSMLPAFSKTLLLAVKHIENIMHSFKTRVRTIERDLSKQYSSLEEQLEDRIKKLDQLENTVQSSRVQGTFSAAPEIAKLKGENRLLKSEIAVLQSNKELRARATSSAHRTSSSRDLTPLNGSAPPPTLARHHSSSAVERLSQQRSPGRTSSLAPLPIPERTSTAGPEPNESRWTHRLRELERRLKAEREARLLDRTGARKRLEEGMRENEELKRELERERERTKSGR
ncbi:MAG: hypothetical protein LQ339_000636 [Xanthoria mediterranea]|nr:MAG: hypothetical protein LQ339_000636 [Xanthoria mediterranea]